MNCTRGRVGLKWDHKPAGSFLFAGPTGVGKTELAKALAEHLFIDLSDLIRFDMSEFKGTHTISRLIGTAPGYKGYKGGGQLTNAVRRKPYCVVLLDEIEKADPGIFDTLLQVLDDGRLTDSFGTADFSNAIVILTSNLGATELQRSMYNGQSFEKACEDAMGAVKKTFKPEFVARLGKVVFFKPLNTALAKQIVALQIGQISELVAREGRSLTATSDAVKYICDRSYNQERGARSIRQWLEENVMADIGRKIHRKELKENSRILMDVLVENGMESLSYLNSDSDSENE